MFMGEENATLLDTYPFKFSLNNRKSISTSRGEKKPNIRNKPHRLRLHRRLIGAVLSDGVIKQ